MDPGPVRIYSTHDSPRLRFILSLLLGEILGLEWELSDDRRKTRRRPVMNYSDENIPGAFRIIPDTLLFEKGIKPREIEVDSWNNLPVFFSSKAEADFPFDVFAASFYLVTRYEEYYDGNRDEHGRYRASESIAFRNGFLHRPVVDLWTRELAKAFIRKFRNVAVRISEFRSLLTIDADETYACSGNSIISSIGEIVGGLKSHKTKLSQKFRALTHEESDTCETFAYITDILKKTSSEARFFFPVGDHSKYDRNPSWKNALYRNLVAEISAQYKTGLHPSYFSYLQKKALQTEKRRLTEIASMDVSSSRFHYLRFRLPESYRQLCDTGISEDFSMGYPDEPGFRAGLARPFFFYDIIEERQTPLRIFPFMVMDETIFDCKKLGKDDAVILLISMISDVRKVGGTFISIWHNTSLPDNDKGRSVREVLEIMLENTGDQAS